MLIDSKPFLAYLPKLPIMAIQADKSVSGSFVAMRWEHNHSVFASPRYSFSHGRCLSCIFRNAANCEFAPIPIGFTLRAVFPISIARD
jgi:hypothetical protein